MPTRVVAIDGTTGCREMGVLSPEKTRGWGLALESCFLG
jgi:hypothetical protein